MREQREVNKVQEQEVGRFRSRRCISSWMWGSFRSRRWWRTSSRRCYLAIGGEGDPAGGVHVNVILVTGLV